MRSRVTCGWLVGHDNGRHVLWRDAELVYENDRIVFAGKRFEGSVDHEIDARGQLVSPGFIDTHVHSGHRASHRLITDGGRADYFGQPFLEISVARSGTRVGGDPRYARPNDAAAREDLELNASFTIAEMLRNGITTFVEFGSQRRVQEALHEQVGKLGIRAYLGPGFDSGRWVGGDGGKLVRVVNEEAGWAEFRGALDFIEQTSGDHNDLVRGIIVPREVEACSLDLMREAACEASARKLPIAIHAAYNIHEFYDMIREHQKTSIELLESVGLLSATTNIGHGNFVAENPMMNYSGGRDLAILGQHRCSISHCPINIALGTDTYPRDMIMNMRTASYFGKVASRNLRAASAAEVFTAATLGGANSVGRSDLGRLAPGAKADIVTIALGRADTLRHGPIRDPIKSLVECGIGDDVDTVIVDGIVRVAGGRIPGVDFAALRDRAQAAGERIWGGWQHWDALGRTAEEMSPFSFPVMG